MTIRVADLSLAAFGKREISLAESEMPALMALREKYVAQQPLAGARIIGCIHMTVQTAVLIKTLYALGAEVRWSSCTHLFDPRPCRCCHGGRWCTLYSRGKAKPKRNTSGALSKRFSRMASRGMPTSYSTTVATLTLMIHEKYPQMLENIHGISEETTTRGPSSLGDA